MNNPVLVVTSSGSSSYGVVGGGSSSSSSIGSSSVSGSGCRYFHPFSDVSIQCFGNSNKQTFRSDLRFKQQVWDGVIQYGAPVYRRQQLRSTKCSSSS